MRRDAHYSQSLDRGLAILASFTAERPLRGIADIADELGLNRSTTHRYVTTLVTLGYLEQAPSRKYKLGHGVHDLGMSVLDRGSLRERAWPYVKKLSTEYPGTINLSILDGQQIVCVVSARSYRARIDPELRIRAGSRLAAYCTAAGKLLLAALAPPGRHRVIAQMKLHAYAPGTITSKTRLREELSEIAGGSDLLAICDEEFAPQLRAVAVPVVLDDEPMAALEMSTGSQILPQELAADMGPPLREAARRIVAALTPTHARGAPRMRGKP
jgi:IclR family pca regulon transcriptional regulator